MSIYNTFGNTICILYNKNLYPVDTFISLNIPAKYIEETRGQFDAHISVLEYAREKNYNNIIVFDGDIMPLFSYKETVICDILKSVDGIDWDVIYLARDFFNNPIPNVIIYNNTSYDKILQDYIDYNGIVEYKDYLQKYVNINSFVSSKYIFSVDTILNRFVDDVDIAIFFRKYYIIIVLCLFTFFVKKYIQYKISCNYIKKINI